MVEGYISWVVNLTEAVSLVVCFFLPYTSWLTPIVNILLFSMTSWDERDKAVWKQ